MKTEVVMQRQFNGKVIRQNSKTGFLNANDLLEAYNINSETEKRLDNYLKTQQVQEYIEVLQDDLESQNVNTSKKGYLELPLTEKISVMATKRGKNGGTWMHPYLFLDFAMWLSPEFKLWAVKIIHDKLIELRNVAGDRYTELTNALKGKGVVSYREYSEEATMLNRVAFGSAKKEQRNSATQEQLDFLDKLQKYDIHLIKEGLTFSQRQANCEKFKTFYQFIK